MKVTTVRFGTDLWSLLEDEAARVGISTSQYIREAALARAAAAAGARGHGPFELLAGALRDLSYGELDPAKSREAELVLAHLARLAAGESGRDAEALRAESRQLVRQAERARRPVAAEQSGD